MAIPESQLETWSNRGALTTSAATYQAIKGVIEDNDAPYSARSISSFLQGSYGNHTNILGVESDVDIILRCASVFYRDLSALSAGDLQLYQAFHTASAYYSYKAFKGDVVDWLDSNFGSDLDPGEKALHLLPRGNRRKADILPCIQHRRYLRYDGTHNPSHYIEGITFFRTDGTQIVNYPEQHYENCVAKNQATNGRFKEIVRVVKNMRNRMRADGLISDGLAPSYYLEGLFHNVPPPNFNGDLGDAFVASFNWIDSANKANLKCANGQTRLLVAGSPIAWEPSNCAAFLRALGEFWSQW